MTKKEIIEGAEKLMNLMGTEVSDYGYYINYDSEFISEVPYTIEKLEFHKNWDWIMSVVEYINKLGFPITIHSACVDITDLSKTGYQYATNSKGEEESWWDDGEIIRVNATDNTTLIELVWTTCVEFCDYYEKNKK